MAASQYVPGMKPGSTGRNVIVGLVYVVLFPLMIFVLIGGVAYHTAKNTNGLADDLSAIPGISEGGGALSGVVVFVGLFVLIVGVGGILGGGGGGDGAPSDTQAAVGGGAGGNGEQVSSPETTTENLPDEEVAVRAARNGAEGQFTERIRSVETAPDFQGRDGYMVEVRVDLNPEVITGADRAEHMGGTVARRTTQAVATSNAKDVRAVAVYAYVPTTDDEATVSTKMVVDLDEVKRVDWSAVPWQRLRDVADQYRFNEYLYN